MLIDRSPKVGEVNTPERTEFDAMFGSAVLEVFGGDVFVIPTMKEVAKAEGLNIDFSVEPIEAVDRGRVGSVQ